MLCSSSRRRYRSTESLSSTPPMSPLCSPTRSRKFRSLGQRSKKKQRSNLFASRVFDDTQVERSTDHNRYLKELITETDCLHPDHTELKKALASSSQMVRDSDRNQSMTDIDRVQELFPHDDLHLHEADPLVPRSKQVHRSRSITANRLQRAFSGKTKFASPERENNNESNRGRSLHRRSRSVGGKKLFCNRTFLMDGPVHLTTSLQSQDRHFFLFSDILLIAKPRSSGNFKLKSRIRVNEIWLGDCLDDVTEVTKSTDTSFVIGWPIINHVACFNTAQAKNQWLSKFKELLAEEKRRDLTCTTTIHVSFYHYINETDTLKLLTVTPSDTAKDCIARCLKELGLSEEERSNYQMWVKTSSDDSPYPLIGHEHPYAIKMNRIKDLFLGNADNEEIQNNLNNNADTRVSFILRNRTSKQSTDTLKKVKKNKKNSGIIHWAPLLNKLNAARQPSTDSIDSGQSSPTTGRLFGVSISQLCPEGSLPEQIMAILRQLFFKGPFTVGIFRKSANARLCREIRAKLDAGEDVDFESTPITVLAALIKELFRSLPECILSTQHYSEWLAAPTFASETEQILQARRIVSELPKSNVLLLQHFLCVLHHIAQKSSENMMSASNLAVCVGPSLLSPLANCTYSPNPTECTAKQIPVLVELLISHCAAIFGVETLGLFGNAPDRDPCRQDSGAEESDSLHGMGERRDDSSIESLERDFSGESSPKLHSSHRNKMSLSNLSRDSGLTLSDTQLYTPDEEMDSEAGDSSNGGDSGLSSGKPAYTMAARSVPHINSAGLQHDEFHDTLDGTIKKCGKNRNKTRTELDSSTNLYDVPKYTRVYTDVNTKTRRLGSSYVSKDNPDELQLRRTKRVLPNLRPVSNIETCNNAIKTDVYRCASEESLLSPFHEYSETVNKRPVTHRKGRAPSPPAVNPKAPTRTARSRRRGNVEWKRSQSTPRLDTTDNRSTSHDSFDHYGNHEMLPTYNEALCRKTIINRLGSPTKGSTQVTDQQRIEQTIASKHARQIYEESLRRYSNNGSGSQDRKMASSSSSSQIKDGGGCYVTPSKGQHYALQRSTSEGNHLKLQHLPPVHLKTETQLGRHKRLSSQKSGSERTGSVNVKYQVHECSVYDDRKDIRCSVAKLRQLFIERADKCQAKSSRQNPPPYRPPPPAAVPARLIFNNGDCASFLHKPVVILQDLPDDIDDSFGEESYV